MVYLNVRIEYDGDLDAITIDDVTATLNQIANGDVTVTELPALPDVAYVEAGINETLNILTRAAGQLRAVMDELRASAPNAKEEVDDG